MNQNIVLLRIMSNAITKQRNFSELVEAMAEIRRVGGSSVIKRENFIDFPEINENIEFEKDNYLQFASFGYIERLVRKLSVAYGASKYSYLKILSYQEACGFFSGELVLYLDAAARESFEEIKFVWEGKGEIENTWDNFKQWEVTTKK
jgi:hypothetical protein